jgi:hypothetical protein
MKNRLAACLGFAISMAVADFARSEGLSITQTNALEVALRIDGVAGKTYSLASSTNLLQWVDEERIPGTSTPQFRRKNIDPFHARFFRLQRLGFVEYLPLVVGSQWTYEPGFGGGPRVDSVTGVEAVQGMLCYKWERQEASPDNYHEIRWLSPGQGTIALHRLATNEGLDDTGAIDPPMLLLKPVFAAAETWTNTLLATGMTLTLIMTATSTNAVATVPAGTFTNCLVLRQYGQIISGGTTNHDCSELWYAPGVGMVMDDDYSDAWVTLKHSQKLTGYRIGAADRDPTP